MKKQLLKMFSSCIVTAMMFSMSAKAQIIYTDVNPDSVVSVVAYPSMINYNIDLNNDGINDYQITCARSYATCGGFGSRAFRSYVSVYALNSNSVIAVTNSANPRAMNFNDSILPGLSLSDTGYFRYVLSGFNCGSTILGVWPNSTEHFLGLKLIVGANTYYGWLRMQVFVGSPTTCTIKDYAYNSISNQPILAGETGTGTTGISENSFSSINLFPNPASNHFTIDLSSNNKKVEVAITDITGKIIYQKASDLENRIEVNTSEFADGIYFVQIQAAGFIGTKRLVVKK